MDDDNVAPAVELVALHRPDVNDRNVHRWVARLVAVAHIADMTQFFLVDYGPEPVVDFHCLSPNTTCQCLMRCNRRRLNIRWKVQTHLKCTSVNCSDLPFVHSSRRKGLDVSEIKNVIRGNSGEEDESTYAVFIL